ncbi:uncharacterized protein PFL1_03153 [Pseudozyma flocculosa PF-1]|uniref:Uncharacterized protein n=1 Tax=Pseudozyma flocculosa PF-1 TaxID=1277687 RepID=A0A061H9W3_9BASI|nr:uncharacterized protein PFL1_03153 [Pseudozyma flocculosa PF-1]EPQ29398.1 hypothetical protein PFL1_03153 [Pseudozyma flocculosa PF-1]
MDLPLSLYQHPPLRPSTDGCQTFLSSSSSPSVSSFNRNRTAYASRCLPASCASPSAPRREGAPPCEPCWPIRGRGALYMSLSHFKRDSGPAPRPAYGAGRPSPSPPCLSQTLSSLSLALIHASASNPNLIPRLGPGRASPANAVWIWVSRLRLPGGCVMHLLARVRHEEDLAFPLGSGRPTPLSPFSVSHKSSLSLSLSRRLLTTLRPTTPTVFLAPVSSTSSSTLPVPRLAAFGSPSLYPPSALVLVA